MLVLIQIARTTFIMMNNNMENTKFKDAQIMEGVALILDGLHLKKDDENLVETPRRILRSYYELFEGINATEQLKELFNKSFPSDYDGMIIVDNISCFSMCPHHFLPVEYTVHVGYLPKSRMLGLSKLPRLVQLLARRPVLQEQFTKDIVTALATGLDTAGAIAVVTGLHNCMRMRGVEKPNATTRTSSVAGIFQTDRSAKEEFLSLIRLRDVNH